MLRLLCSTRALNPLRRISTQHAAPENYYKLLGIAEHFRIDTETLSERFKALQRQWHPDKFGQAGQAEQEAAAAMSARLNEAYATLRTPDRRAKHLLHLRTGSPVTNGSPEYAPLDPAFLVWVVETREAIASAAGNVKLMKPLKEEARSATEQCLKAIAAAFEQGDLSRAGEETGKLQYLRRIESAIEDFTG